MSGRLNPVAESAEVWAAAIAAQFAQEMGLKPGNLWEPGYSRGLLAEYESLCAVADISPAQARIDVAASARDSLGLS